MHRRSTVVAIWSLLIAGAAYLFIFEPGKSGFFPICPFRFLTGFTCPGCGGTRALHQLLHGNVETAFTLNPLLLIAIPFLLFLLIRYSAIAMRGGVPRPIRMPAMFTYALVAIVLSFWIFRNTPFYPFVS